MNATLRAGRCNGSGGFPTGGRSFSVVEQREWIAPFAEGQTPMYAALLHAYELVRDWCAVRDHRECYPPAIFNITDGEASDSDEEGLSELAARIRGTGTDDGNALLMNIHISSDLTKTPVVFAASEEELPEQRYARLLYRMSSVMPRSITKISLRCAVVRPVRSGASVTMRR